MHRAPLLALLEAHRTRHPEASERALRIERFVRAHPDCLLRSCLPGHVTGSAWVVSDDRTRVLLTHHRKLDRWLQLGGHADGDPDLFAVALREAREESGLASFAAHPAGEPPVPLDVDVHTIPARSGEPAHLHHDLRFLLVARPGQPLRVSEESHALRWVPWHELPALSGEESLLRMARYAREALGLG